MTSITLSASRDPVRQNEKKYAAYLGKILKYNKILKYMRELI